MRLLSMDRTTWVVLLVSAVWNRPLQNRVVGELVVIPRWPPLRVVVMAQMPLPQLDTGLLTFPTLRATAAAFLVAFGVTAASRNMPPSRCLETLALPSAIAMSLAFPWSRVSGMGPLSVLDIRTFMWEPLRNAVGALKLSMDLLSSSKAELFLKAVEVFPTAEPPVRAIRFA